MMGNPFDGLAAGMLEATVYVDDYGSTSMTAGFLPIDGHIAGEIATIGDTDWFTVILTAGNVYSFSMQGSPTGMGTLGDTSLALRNSYGQQLAYNDDTNASLDAGIVYIPTVSGLHYLEAKAYGAGTGTYTLSAERAVNNPIASSTVTLVSQPDVGTSVYRSSCAPSLSADGRFVVFESYSSNLVSGDYNGVRDIFLRDTRNNTTRLISQSTWGEQGNNESYAPSLSVDGRFVVFGSSADNLVDGDDNGVEDIFLHDTLHNSTILISQSSSGARGNDASRWSSVSSDGRFVVFTSYANNLVEGDNNGNEDIFLRDTLNNTTTLISQNTSGTQGNSYSYD
ncbi:TolB family protein, partial [Candidatus Magnetobacterium casense]|uniref:TolB family protein n=1 Tax=Candidatus Magnetobacterium casense TaxID=1455061 RepID=UPI001F2D3836